MKKIRELERSETGARVPPMKLSEWAFRRAENAEAVFTSTNSSPVFPSSHTDSKILLER
jgi:hypothetical protein